MVLTDLCMKQLVIVTFLIGLIVSSCTPEPKDATMGTVTYAIDYPDHKDNFFLYSILPKEMTVNFRDGVMESRIEKANLSNVLLVDCNQSKVSAYFQYGDEEVHVVLQPDDVTNMVKDQKQYTIVFTEEKDTMAGFHVKKAIATAKKDPSDKIELWYTDEIKLKNSNWYNPFHEVPGFLLAYAIDRYGIRMEFKAKWFEAKEITKEQLQFKANGISISYQDYNAKLGSLFQSFD